MPYSIERKKNKWYVKNGDTGELTPEGGYTTQSQAQDYMKALYVNVDDAKRDVALSDCKFVAVRSMAQPEEIEGYLAVWGSPEQRDCYGTFFNKEQPPLMDLEFIPFPLRYAHGQDTEIGATVVGSVVKVWLDDFGIKFRALLDKAGQFYQRVVNEITQGKLGISTGTNDYLAEFTEDGQFVTWPIGSDVSLTDRPCEFRMPAVAAIRSLNGHQLELAVKPIAPEREAVTVDDPWDCGCDEQASTPPALTHTNSSVKNSVTVREYLMKVNKTKRAAAPAPKVPAGVADGAEEKPRGLTMGHLGLGDEATLDELYEALCNFLGDNAANAIWNSAMGATAEEVEPGDDESMLDDELMNEREDPEADNRPSDYMGNENLEDLTEGEPDGPATRRASDLTAVLTRLLANQQRASKPRSQRSAPNAQIAKLEKQVKDLRRQLRDAPVDEPHGGRFDRRSNGGGQMPRIDARDLRYDGLSASDAAYAVQTLRSAGKMPSESLVRAASYKIAHEIEKGTPLGADLTVNYLTPFRSRSEVMQMDSRAMLKSFRSNEVMGDANTGYGSNYIGVFYDTSLWLKVRAMPIWRELEARGMEEKVIPVGYASDVIPLEGADFTWYRVPETVDVDATGRPKINITPSKAGTSSTTLTVRTLGALVYYSVLLEEDSIVPMAAELNRKATIQTQEQIEYVLFNGDTATGTGNLNYKNGTVNASDVYNFTTADGMLKAGIVGNSGNSARQANGLSDTDYQLLLGLIGASNNYITGSDPTKLMFVVDPATGLATDRLPIVKTKDINSAATIENGHVKEMYAVPLFRSGQISLADSTGYIDSVTAANNKYGRISLIRPDQWVVGFKRQVTMEYFRDVPGQSNGMVITLRLGLQYRDAAQAAAATYGVTVK